LTDIAQPADVITDFSACAAFRLQYFVYGEVLVTSDVDLLKLEVVELAFYRFVLHVFQPVRGRVGGYARLDSEQFARPFLLVTFVERCVARLRDAYDIARCEMPTHDRFFGG